MFLTAHLLIFVHLKYFPETVIEVSFMLNQESVYRGPFVKIKVLTVLSVSTDLRSENGKAME